MAKMELLPEDEAALQRAAEERDRKAREEAERAAAELERTGGSCHPNTVFGFTTSPGLTLRDYFAAHFPKGWDTRDGPEVHAKLAYDYADAMLKARKPVRE